MEREHVSADGRHPGDVGTDHGQPQGRDGSPWSDERRRRDREDPAPVADELPHVPETMPELETDLGVERVREERAEVRNAKDLERAREAEEADGKPRERPPTAPAPEPERGARAEEQALGTRDRGEAAEESRPCCGLDPRGGRHAEQDQEHEERGLHAGRAPEEDAGVERHHHRGERACNPAEPRRHPARHPAHHEDGGRGGSDVEHVGRSQQRCTEAVQTCEEEHPRGSRVAFDPLPGVEDRPESGGQVLRVAEVDEGIVDPEPPERGGDHQRSRREPWNDECRPRSSPHVTRRVRASPGEPTRAPLAIAIGGRRRARASSATSARPSAESAAPSRKESGA